MQSINVFVSCLQTYDLWFFYSVFFSGMLVLVWSFSALTLLVGRQEGQLAFKKRVVGYWHSYLSGARCRLAYCPVDATATYCLLLQ